MNANKKYKVGLVMSGGGAKGFAHIGAIKALEEAGIYPDIISGTSAGSLIGVLYADGHTPNEIQEYFSDLSFTDLAKVVMPRDGFFNIDRFRNFLKSKLRAKNFEELKIPLLVTTTDLDNGRSVVFSSGPLIEVISASCSIPIIFTPIVINDTHYVDGGIFSNFPVKSLIKDCDIVIGINVTPLIAKEYKMNILSIALRSYNFIAKSNSLEEKKMCDILVETEDISEYNIFDLAHIKEISDVGYRDTKAALAKNKKILQYLNEDKQPNALQISKMSSDR